MQFVGVILTFFAAIGGVLLNLLTDPFEKWVVGIFSGIALLGSLINQLRYHRQTDQFTFADEQKYHKTMLALIKGERRIAIVTTQLDWVTEDNDIGRELTAKAKSLTLIILKRNKISTYFARKGAEVFYYDKLGFKFNGGFTIVGDPDDVHRIAIGMRVPNRNKTKPAKRRLHIFRSSEDPAAKLAQCQYHYLKAHGEPHV